MLASQLIAVLEKYPDHEVRIDFRDRKREDMEIVDVLLASQTGKEWIELELAPIEEAPGPTGPIDWEEVDPFD